jgi:two-component system chemotaxis response regulator CheB
MPPNFTKSFAQRLDGLCEMNVHEAKDSERILLDNAYIAPGDKHISG